MHKYIALFFSVSFLLTACKGKNGADDIIDPKTMTRLLVDVHIIDGRTYALQQNPDTLYKFATGKYLGLFQKYHTDSTQFNNSFRYYSNNPVQLLAIYDQVLVYLKQKTDSLNTIQMAVSHKTDSVNAIKNKRMLDSIKKIQKQNLPQQNPPKRKQIKNALP